MIFDPMGVVPNKKVKVVGLALEVVSEGGYLAKGLEVTISAYVSDSEITILPNPFSTGANEAARAAILDFIKEDK